MHYKIRYPGSRPRTSTAKAKSKHNWMHNGTKLAGFHVAGQCIVCLLIFGFGLSIIGSLSLLMSASAGLHDGQYQTPPAIVGFTLLSSGVAILFMGLIFFCCAAKRAKLMYVRERSACPTVKDIYQAPDVTEGAQNVDPNSQVDPSVYYINGGQDCANPDQYAIQNSGYITDKPDEPDPGFTGFTYSDVGEQPADGNNKEDDNQPRGFPARLPPINRDENKTVYSTPATFGLKE